MKAVLIPVEGEPREIEADDLDALQAAVGGYIEVVVTPGAPFVMYVNEEGKFRGLTLNHRAGRLANRYRPWRVALLGDAVLVGPPTAAGDDTEFTLHDWEGVAVGDAR